MKDTDLYSKILGVEDPWHVDHVDISVENQSIRVYLKHDDKVEWRCPLCNKVSPVYDHREEREWRHLDSCQFKTILVASLPRINCPKHGIHTIDVPWSNLNSRFTLLFEAFAIDVLGLAKVQVAAARLLRLSPSQVHSIMCRAVARGLSERDSTESITHDPSQKLDESVRDPSFLFLDEYRKTPLFPHPDSSDRGLILPHYSWTEMPVWQNRPRSAPGNLPDDSGRLPAPAQDFFLLL